MSLRIRRGTDAQRSGVTFDQGEIVYTTDTKKLYVGDGVTAGGVNILATSAGTGVSWDAGTQAFDFNPSGLGLTTSNVSEGSNQYFTSARALTAVGSALTAGNAYNTGITFTLDTVDNRITAVVSASGGGIASVSADTNPSLGANLNIAGHSIVSTNAAGTINITGNIITAGAVQTPALQVTAGSSLQVFIPTTGSQSFPLQINGARGSLGAPTPTQAGDYLGNITVKGYSSGSTYLFASNISTQWDATADLTKQYPNSNMYFIVGNNTNSQSLSSSPVASLSYTGNFTTKAITTGSYAGSGTYPSPVAGMIIFDSSNNHFYGYNGTTWKQLDN